MGRLSIGIELREGGGEGLGEETVNQDVGWRAGENHVCWLFDAVDTIESTMRE